MNTQSHQSNVNEISANEARNFTRDRWETVVGTVLNKLSDNHPTTKGLVSALVAMRMGNNSYSTSKGREELKKLQDNFGKSIGIGSQDAVQMAVDSIGNLIEHELQVQ